VKVKIAAEEQQTRVQQLIEKQNKGKKIREQKGVKNGRNTTANTPQGISSNGNDCPKPSLAKIVSMKVDGPSPLTPEACF